MHCGQRDDRAHNHTLPTPYFLTMNDHLHRYLYLLHTKGVQTVRTFVRMLPQLGGLLVALFVTGSLYAYFGMYQPPAFFPVREIVSVPQGATLEEVANLLYEEQVIRSAFAFRALVRFTGQDTTIDAGDYYFEYPLTLDKVALRLSNGEYGLTPLEIVVPEGATTYQMAELFDATFESFDPITFLMLAEDKEGYLYPDTYQFLPNVRTTVVMDTLERTFYERLANVEEAIAAFGRPIHEIVTMASLLEKEAWDHEERRTIAGILWERLSINMPLQVDAVFGFIKRTETFSPLYSDLEVESPYNTYKNTGLPPGPIGSPSLSSIEAAVTPKETTALFYLHGNDGTLHVARTYEEHLVNKRRYLD